MTHPVDLLYLPLGAAALGGAERSLLELASGMQDRGYSVAVAADKPLAATPFPELVAEMGLDLVWHEGSPGKSLLANFRAFADVFRRFSPRIVHFNVSWRRHMWAAPLVARRLLDARLVGTMRAMPDPHQNVPRRRHFGVLPGLQLWRLEDRVSGFVWARTLDATVSINRLDFPPRLEAEFGFRPSQLRTIYNGIRVPPLPTPAERAQRRTSLGLSNEQFVLVFAGRLAPEKGVEDLLQALAQLPSHFVILVAGEGPDEARLKQVADKCGVAGRVLFLGFVREVRQVLLAGDAIVVPSTWPEPFGRVVPEAMAVGLPVVATRVGGMAELLEDGVDGIYVEPHSPEQLARALLSLDADRGWLRRVATNARSSAEKRYSVARVIDEYADLYRSLDLVPASA